MRDGQGCLLPVLRCSSKAPLLKEVPDMPWPLPRTCRAEAISPLPSPVNLRPNSAKRKRQRKLKDAAVGKGYGSAHAICQELNHDSPDGTLNQGSLLEGVTQEHLGGEEVGNKPVESEYADGRLHSVFREDGETSEAREEDKRARTSDESSEYCSDSESYLPGLDEETALRCLAYVSLSDHQRLAMVAKKHHRLVRSSLLFDLRRRYKVVEQWVCIYTSDDNGWTAFDPKQRRWRNLPSAKVNMTFSFSDRESLSAGTHLLWLGREALDFACYKYDLITNSWERGPPMVNSRCLFASASCGEFAFVAGGFEVVSISLHSSSQTLCTTSCVLNTAERYDARSGKWEALPPMHTPRQKCSGVFMDGKFYVIGGKDRDHNALTSGEVYDPLTRSWTMIPNMYILPDTTPSFEPSPPLLAVAGNELYAIESSSNLLKGYLKNSNSWKVLGPVPVRTDVSNGWGLAFKALGDELFVIGSYQPPGSREGVAVFSWKPQLDATTPEWRPGDPSPEWRMVNIRVRGNGTFLYNCAVMSC